MSGEVYKEPKKPSKPLPSLSFPESVPLTVQFTDEASQFGEISGGKGSSLGKLTQLSKEEKTFIVPKGIIVTTSAYKEYLTPEISHAIKYLEDIAYGNEPGDLQEACKEVSYIVENSMLPNRICHSIIEDLKDIFGDEVNYYKFAVRSSATGEDTSAMSAAGQMDTFLGVQGVNEIFIAVKKCWASQFGYIAIEYKRRNGQVLNSPMAVVIQEMVACDVSGVLFTCDPVTNNPSVITITANYGLGETVVSGFVEPDTIVLRRKDNGKLEFESVVVGSKHQRIVMQDSGGTVIEDIDEDTKSQSCLSSETAERLGKLAIKIERFYKSSRDIEWGILDDEIYILQSRPVTNATAETDHEIKHEFDAPLRSESEYFTVANVGEVMPGATSPLGIETLTKCFSNVLKRDAFEKGIVDNLFQSKYFLTGILPFFNNMMITVAEMLVRYGLNTPRSKGFMISVFGRILDDPDLLEYASHKAPGEFKSSLMSDLRYYKELFFFDYGIEKAKKKFDNYHLDFLKPKTAKETFKAILNSCSDFDEAVHYHMQCSENSSNWNMYMFTTLCDAKGNFDTDVYSDFASLLATSSDVESANVPQAMQDVADQIVKDIGKEKFSSMSVEEALEWLKTSTSTAGFKFRQFVNRHGHRCLREFDVKSITWGMDPKLLVKLLQNLAGTSKGDTKKEKSIDAIFSELNVPLSFMSKCYLRFVLPQCRRGVRRREFSKSLTIKCFDHWRQGFRHLAKLMVSEGRLPEEDLLFFLTYDEINDLLETRSPSIISRANYRKRVFSVVQNYKFPEIMKGTPKPVNEEEESADTYEFIADLTMKGAVVSREYGLPCVVGLQGATKKFRTGDYVLLDGKKGILQRLPEPEE
ncbi:probable phosphoenolpyruvate synthase [Trichonephila inaurata madagascariensis]|uniref:Probable phosphoenolpyruvate synthase n=1 Tax=Trichonephila inaurata madagascariensis TaxID=2747483 RepID=A0A8X7BP89_9ARAC|nr:probable phosphoenolpyruvate synthase [Trichonephila inaurata madagascariensis]